MVQYLIAKEILSITSSSRQNIELAKIHNWIKGYIIISKYLPKWKATLVNLAQLYEKSEYNHHFFLF